MTESDGATAASPAKALLAGPATGAASHAERFRRALTVPRSSPCRRTGPGFTRPDTAGRMNVRFVAVGRGTARRCHDGYVAGAELRSSRRAGRSSPARGWRPPRSRRRRGPAGPVLAVHGEPAVALRPCVRGDRLADLQAARHSTSSASCRDGRGMAEAVLEDGLARLHTPEARGPSSRGDCLRTPYFCEG